jgi:septal ring factor EnvC (AmiA/AmiB activator)
MNGAKLMFEYQLLMKTVVKYLFILISLIVVFSVYGQEKESDRLKKQQKQLEKKIDLTKTLLENTQKSKASLNEKIGLIEKKIAYRRALLDNLGQQLSKLETDIEQISIEISQLEIEIAKHKEQYKQMLLQAYKMRNADASLVFILSAETFNQANKRMEYLEQLAKYRADQIKKIQATKVELEAQKANLLAKRTEKDQVAKLKANEQQIYVQDREKQKETITSIQGKEAELKRELAAQQKQSDDIRNAINAAINKEILAAKKKAKEQTKAETKEIALSSAGFEANKGRLPWPVKSGEITKGFGKQPHPVHSNVFTYNSGIDITTVRGSTVRAVYEGDVTSVIVIPGAGKAVIIAHGDYRTIYSNLQETYVKTGDHVNVKDEIGALLIDRTGNSGVHFEIRQITSDGQINNINPTYWLYQ